MAAHGGVRPGAGRKPKRLLDHARDGTFSVSRHAGLLASDDSVLEAAAVAPEDDYWIRSLAEYCRVYREGNGTYLPGAGAMVRAFAHTVRRARPPLRS